MLFLLVENRLADFHAELELMTEEEQQQPAISFCTQLDRHLMVGSYKEVMVEAASPPFNHYTFFLRSLLETVRVNIIECMNAAPPFETKDSPPIEEGGKAAKSWTCGQNE